MTCLLKNRIWKDEANQYTTIDDFQNVFAEGLDGLTSFVPALFPQKVGRTIGDTPMRTLIVYYGHGWPCFILLKHPGSWGIVLRRRGVWQGLQ